VPELYSLLTCTLQVMWQCYYVTITIAMCVMFDILSGWLWSVVAIVFCGFTQLSNVIFERVLYYICAVWCNTVCTGVLGRTYGVPHWVGATLRSGK
jgi:hypothetical protein